MIRASPSKPKFIMLTGKNLRISDVEFFVENPLVRVNITKNAIENVRKAREFLKKKLKNQVIYGVTTGFGPMASYVIKYGQLTNLQKHLVRSHAVGIGNPIDEKYVQATMLVRLNMLLKGYSGVSVELIEQLGKFINHRVIPVVPEHGAVGTSGDLVQLAHIALALMGEGEVFYQGKKSSTSKVLQELKIAPYQLKPKEGLSLINGTSTMTGIAALLCTEAERLTSIALRLGALSLELVQGYDDSISEELHLTRPHKGQVKVAHALRTILASSHMLRKRNKLHQPLENGEDVVKISQTVQEFYSLRCIPQVLGPVFDTLSNTKKIVEVEMNSASDNPIVDWKNKLILHGGNFHGDYIASSVDQLKIALVKLSLLSERRINFFLNHEINKFFPPFMNLQTPGLTLGLQGLQFVATSTAAQNQTLAFPHYIHSIPTNGDNQDIVSMGTDAALFAMKVVDNTYVVLAVELITLAQAIDFLGKKEKFSASSKELFKRLRSVFPVVKDDRTIAHELPRVVELLKCY